MKVLHILNELNYSGAEIMYTAAAKSFIHLGCQLYVVNTSKRMGDYASHFIDAGYSVVHIPYSRSFKGKLTFYNRINNYIKKEHIDIVHIHRDGIKCAVSFLAWQNCVKCICTYHSVFSSTWYNILYHISLRWCMTHIFKCIQQSISETVYRNEKEYYYNNTILVYNWYDSNKFYPALEGEKLKIRNELNIHQDAKVIISVGSCRELKRHKDIIEAVSILKETYPDICYLHLGEGEMLESEKRLAEEKDVSDNIRFLGNQTDVRKYLLAADVYVMTSRLEGLSLSTIEAMACGIPAILYHVPGLQDFNIKMECSLQIEESSFDLTNACSKIFKNEIDVNSIRNNAYYLVHEKFNMNNNVNRIYNLYIQ